MEEVYKVKDNIGLAKTKTAYKTIRLKVGGKLVKYHLDILRLS
jgi:hypothetical protein